MKTEPVGGPDHVTEHIVRWAQNFSYQEAETRVVELSKQLILDCIGVGVAATRDPVGRQAIDLAGLMGIGNVAVLGTERRLAAADAAYVNGTLMHTLDFDDFGYGGHGSVCVLPAVLAVGQATPIAPTELLSAYLVGMEVFGRLALSTSVEETHLRGWYPTGVFGMLASAVGAAKAAGADREQSGRAVAMGASSGCGVRANVGSCKPSQAGHAASQGVRALQLAQVGLSGRADVLEAKAGFGDAYFHGQIDWASFREGLGSPLRMSDRPPFVKAYPSCGGTQNAISGVSKLMAREGIHIDAVKRIDVHIDARLLTVLRYDWPSTPYEAKFCLPYTVALAATSGGATIADFTPARIMDDRLQEARRKIRVIPNLGSVDPWTQAHLSIETVDGRIVELQSVDVHGSPTDPMSEAEMVAKFNGCVSGSLTDSQAQQVVDAVLGMDGSTTAEEFWSAWELTCSAAAAARVS